MKIALILLLSLIQENSSKRILDVYAKDADDKIYLEQLRLLHADPEGLKERDVVVRKHLEAPGFKIVLTGKDGGEKYSSEKILTLAKLYALIDAMPMRKAEILKQSINRSKKE